MPRRNRRTLFLLEEGVCWSLMLHESSSRKRGFALEGKSEVSRVQAAAFRKEGRPGGVQGEGTGNLALLSWLSLVVVDWRKGLPGRRPAEQCQGEGRSKPRPRADGHEDVFLHCLHTFVAAVKDRRESFGDFCS